MWESTTPETIVAVGIQLHRFLQNLALLPEPCSLFPVTISMKARIRLCTACTSQSYVGILIDLQKPNGKYVHFVLPAKQPTFVCYFQFLYLLAVYGSTTLAKMHIS